MLFTGATKHGVAGKIWDLHPAVLQPCCNKKGMPNLPLEWERHICRPIDFWGLKGKLIYPQAYPTLRPSNSSLYHTARRRTTTPTTLVIIPKSLTAQKLPPSPPNASPSAPLCLLSLLAYLWCLPLNRQGGVALPVPVSLTSPAAPPLACLSPFPQIISKGRRWSKLALLSKWTGMGDVFS